MELSRPNASRRNKRSRDTLDRRVDNWLETGRQFVNGVAGTRPGTGRLSGIDRRSGSRLQSVGRWVGDKIDWFLEDDDDWQEPWEEENQLTKYQGKRPLKAISLRVFSPNSEEKIINNTTLSDETWPDESSFKIDRWQREKSTGPDEKATSKRTNYSDPAIERRPLPRSSRKR